MSWSSNYIGTPENITKALQDQSAALSGKSKEEFDAAIPHISGILAQNYNKTTTPVMRLSAYGHGHDGYNTLSVTVEYLNGALV